MNKKTLVTELVTTHYLTKMVTGKSVDKMKYRDCDEVDLTPTQNAIATTCVGIFFQLVAFPVL